VLLVTGGGIGEVRFWDAKTRAKRSRSITASAGWMSSLDFDRTGEILVTGGTDSTTRHFAGLDRISAPGIRQRPGERRADRTAGA
jgi:WD40 repeat protein